MRALLVGTLIAGLGACTTPVPDSGAGVGFQDYNSYLRDRELQLNTGVRPGVAVPAPSTATPGFSTERIGAALDAASGVPQPYQSGQPQVGALIPTTPPAGGLPATRPRGDAPAGIRVESGEMQGGGAAAGISDEQDFDAVSARETIQSDAERRAQQQAQYQVIAPTALPTRTGAEGPNIVEFAISTSHAPGTAMYPRSSLRLTNPDVACSRYGSPDLAQQAFLEGGGPQRERKALDPDGDGFACSWDPRPFRNALQ